MDKSNISQIESSEYMHQMAVKKVWTMKARKYTHYMRSQPAPHIHTCIRYLYIILLGVLFELCEQDIALTLLYPLGPLLTGRLLGPSTELCFGGSNKSIAEVLNSKL
jgi:hypothetical protein